MTELQIDIRDHIMQVTLNRPDIHNAISHKSMIDEIIDMIKLANQDTSIRALIITGAGKSFCAGGNVKNMRDKTDMFSGNIESFWGGFHQTCAIDAIASAIFAIYDQDIPAKKVPRCTHCVARCS